MSFTPKPDEAPDVLARGDQELAGVPGRNGEQLGGARRGGGDQRREPFIEGEDLAVELGDAPGERAQRELGGLQRLVQTLQIGAQTGAERGLAARGLAAG